MNIDNYINSTFNQNPPKTENFITVWLLFHSHYWHSPQFSTSSYWSGPEESCTTSPACAGTPSHGSTCWSPCSLCHRYRLGWGSKMFLELLVCHYRLPGILVPCRNLHLGGGRYLACNYAGAWLSHGDAGDDRGHYNDDQDHEDYDWKVGNDHVGRDKQVETERRAWVQATPQLILAVHPVLALGEVWTVCACIYSILCCSSSHNTAELSPAWPGSSSHHTAASGTALLVSQGVALLLGWYPLQLLP